MVGRVANLRSGREEMASLGPAGLMLVGKHDGEEVEKREEVFNMRKTFHLVEITSLNDDFPSVPHLATPTHDRLASSSIVAQKRALQTTWW